MPRGTDDDELVHFLTSWVSFVKMIISFLWACMKDNLVVNNKDDSHERSILS